MRSSLLFFLSLLMLQLSAQEFNVSDEAITFPNGTTVDNPVNSQIPIPVGGHQYIFAEFSNGIEGNITLVDYVNDVELFGFENVIAKETDGSGEPTNDVIERYQFTIYKKVDDASVKLLEKFSDNQNISEIIIKIVSPSGGGGMALETKYSITLNNVKIAKQRFKTEYDTVNTEFLFFEKYNLYARSIEFKDFSANQTTILD